MSSPGGLSFEPALRVAVCSRSRRVQLHHLAKVHLHVKRPLQAEGEEVGSLPALLVQRAGHAHGRHRHAGERSPFGPLERLWIKLARQDRPATRARRRRSRT